MTGTQTSMNIILRGCLIVTKVENLHTSTLQSHHLSELPSTGTKQVTLRHRSITEIY